MIYLKVNYLMVRIWQQGRNEGVCFRRLERF